MPKSPNYFEVAYKAPFKGIHTQLPETEIPQEYALQAQNVLLRNGEIRSRPRFVNYIPPIQAPDAVGGIVSFIDANNVTHTCVITNRGLYQLNSSWKQNPSKAWSLVGYFPSRFLPSSGIPVVPQTYLNQLYFVNGSANLWLWDGITSPTKTNPNVLQSTAVINQSLGYTAGAFFLGVLNQQLLMLNTVEQISTTGFTNFQQRIRWCANGLPQQWDPTVNTAAGFNDLLDVPDAITGYMSIGQTGFIFRINGITEMFPITQGLLPFDFNHMWASERGIGNIYPYTISNFGPVGVFVSTDDIYSITLSAFDKISGMTKDAIYNDLNAATSSPIGGMLPSFATNYLYTSYLMYIPIGSGSSVWLYEFENKSWVNWTFSSSIFTGPNRIVKTL